MTDTNWAIPGAGQFLRKPTAPHDAAEAAMEARRRTALGTAEEVRAQRQREVDVLRARHEAMLGHARDPIVKALIEAHSPQGDERLWPSCMGCPSVPDMYGDSEPEGWPCSVWVFISERMETP